MSLRAFHIGFIALSALLSGGAAAWAVIRTRAGDAGLVWLAALGAAACVGLIAYLVRFVRSGTAAS
jgi:hypothetical protein